MRLGRGGEDVGGGSAPESEDDLCRNTEFPPIGVVFCATRTPGYWGGVYSRWII